MMIAPPIPIAHRAAISWLGGIDPGGDDGGGREEPEAEEERAAAAEPIAERAGREQQPGEDERVPVDDPLQLAVGGVQVLRERRQRDVEDRVVQSDDDEAEAEHSECRPASSMDLRGIHGGLSSRFGGGLSFGSDRFRSHPWRYWWYRYR